jgi:hypothetical protein
MILLKVAHLIINQNKITCVAGNYAQLSSG